MSPISDLFSPSQLPEWGNVAVGQLSQQIAELGLRQAFDADPNKIRRCRIVGSRHVVVVAQYRAYEGWIDLDIRNHRIAVVEEEIPDIDCAPWDSDRLVERAAVVEEAAPYMGHAVRDRDRAVERPAVAEEIVPDVGHSVRDLDRLVEGKAVLHKVGPDVEESAWHNKWLVEGFASV